LPENQIFAALSKFCVIICNEQTAALFAFIFGVLVANDLFAISGGCLAILMTEATPKKSSSGTIKKTPNSGRIISILLPSQYKKHRRA
jgi:hypothetical protein